MAAQAPYPAYCDVSGIIYLNCGSHHEPATCLKVHLIYSADTIRKIIEGSVMSNLNVQQLFTVLISVAIVAGFICQWMLTF